MIEFLPRDATLARILTTGLCLCLRVYVCASVTRRYCIETAARIIDSGKLWYRQNEGTYFWDVVPKF